MNLENKITEFWKEIITEIQEEQNNNIYKMENWKHVIDEQQTLYRLILKFYPLEDFESDILIIFNKMFNLYYK